MRFFEIIKIAKYYTKLYGYLEVYCSYLAVVTCYALF
jgi:hypothetical protein